MPLWRQCLGKLAKGFNDVISAIEGLEEFINEGLGHEEQEGPVDGYGRE
jgi:hypothetical protein